MKEEFKIMSANCVVPYNTKRFFRNPIYTRLFSDSNGRKYGFNDRNYFNQVYQYGLTNGLNARQPFFRVGGEATTTTGPTLSPQRAPSGISVEVQDAVPNEQKGVPPASNIKNVPFQPPSHVFIEGMQVGLEIVCEEMVNDWWRIIGKAWYYAQLYRLERGYEIFPKEEKVLRIHGVTEYDENIRRENGEYAEKWRGRAGTL
jgi:hypothetical protein